MSRTYTHTAPRFRALSDPTLRVEYHHHPDGICHLPDRVNADNWQLSYGCGWYVSWPACRGRNLFCGCPLCTGRHERRQARRRDRHQARQDARRWVIGDRGDW